MKKKYVLPTSQVVELAVENGILAGSAGERFELEMSDETAIGAEALSVHREIDWNTEWD